MGRQLRKITYVEDDPDIRSVAELTLTQIGEFEVDVCACAEDALEKAPEFDPDLIILDVMMPGMSGLDAYRELRKIPGLESTPVIFMTAKVRNDEIADLEALGAAGVIPKPFDAMQLPGSIRDIWNRISGEPGG